MNIGAVIDRLMSERGMSNAELSRRLRDVSPQAIGKWRSGKTMPDASRLEAIGDALGVRPEHLIQEPRRRHARVDADTVVFQAVIGPMLRDFLVQAGRRLRMVRKIVSQDLDEMLAELGLIDLGLCDSATWRSWERGEAFPSVLALVKICDRYGMTLDWVGRGKLRGMDEGLVRVLIRSHPEIVQAEHE